MVSNFRTAVRVARARFRPAARTHSAIPAPAIPSVILRVIDYSGHSSYLEQPFGFAANP